MTGVEGIPDDVLARAVEAAAKAMCADEVASGYSAATWDNSFCERGWYLRNARAAVTAALAEVEAPIKAQALREYADATRHPWTVFRRDDGSPVTVNDLMRETADRIEAGDDRG